MYICEICEAEFDEPAEQQSWREPMPDGCFQRLYTLPVCPFCDQPYFVEVCEDDEQGPGTYSERTGI